MILIMKDIKSKWIFTLICFQAWASMFTHFLFLVCNAKRGEDGFHKIMRFNEYVVPYKWNSDWIEGELDRMLVIRNQNEIPKANECCKNCAYSDQSILQNSIFARFKPRGNYSRNFDFILEVILFFK